MKPIELFLLLMLTFSLYFQYKQNTKIVECKFEFPPVTLGDIE